MNTRIICKINVDNGKPNIALHTNRSGQHYTELNHVIGGHEQYKPH